MKINPGNARGLLVPQGDRPFSFVVYSSEIRDFGDYKDIVLGLIFLKYISDSFEERYQELIEEGEGYEEDRDFYEEKCIFFVPKTARWSVIKEKVA